MNRRLSHYLLIAPSTLVFAALFIAPFVYFFIISFWQVKFYKLRAGFSFSNYAQTFTEYLGIGLFTLYLALIAAVLTTFIGFLYAYVIRFKAGRWGPALLFIALITLFGGYLMKIYAWKTILGTEGVLNSLLLTLGITDEPLTALLYSPGSVVVTLLHFLLPFAILPIYASLRAVSDLEIEVARDLGARARQILFTIIIPRCRTGLVAAFMFCFLLAAGDYITALLVGGKMTMIGNLIAWQFGQYFNWPLGAAMSFTVLAAALLVILTVTYLTSLWRPR